MRIVGKVTFCRVSETGLNYFLYTYSTIIRLWFPDNPPFLSVCLSTTFQPGCYYYVGETTPRPYLSCTVEEETRLNGEIFPSVDGCNECWCDYGKLACRVDDKCKRTVGGSRSSSRSSNDE